MKQLNKDITIDPLVFLAIIILVGLICVYLTASITLNNIKITCVSRFTSIFNGGNWSCPDDKEGYNDIDAEQQSIYDKDYILGLK